MEVSLRQARAEQLQLFLSIMDSERELPEEYASIIKKQARRSFRGSPTYFDQAWKTVMNDPTRKEMADFIRERLRGRFLVDLGGGFGGLDLPDFPVTAYINVDIYEEAFGAEHNQLVQNPMQPVAPIRTGDHYPYFDKNKRPIFSVYSDMLTFLAKVKSGSICCAMNGIDDHIIQVPEYGELLAQELVRVTVPGGVILGYISEPMNILDRQVKDGHVRLVKHSFNYSPAAMKDHGHELFVFEKL